MNQAASSHNDPSLRPGHLKLQSFRMTRPKICSSAAFTLWPCNRGTSLPTTTPIASSQSVASEGPNAKGFGSDGVVSSRKWPCGRTIGVPDGTIVLARPLYAVGKFEISQLNGFFAGNCSSCIADVARSRVTAVRSSVLSAGRIFVNVVCSTPRT